MKVFTVVHLSGDGETTPFAESYTSLKLAAQNVEEHAVDRLAGALAAELLAEVFEVVGLAARAEHGALGLDDKYRPQGQVTVVSKGLVERFGALVPEQGGEAAYETASARARALQAALTGGA